MDMFLILGLIIVFLLSLIVYLVDKLLNRKKTDKQNYTFIKRYPVILITFLLVFAIIYLMKISAVMRILYGIIILSLPSAGLIYYIRSLDKNIIKNSFVKTYFAVLILLLGSVIVLAIYMYNADYQNITEEKKPTFASENGIFSYEKKSCGTETFDGLGYRVEYCSYNTETKDNYRISYWFSKKWVYEVQNNQDDNKWCNCKE